MAMPKVGSVVKYTGSWWILESSNRTKMTGIYVLIPIELDKARSEITIDTEIVKELRQFSRF